MDLYGEIILDHYRNPHHKGRIEKPTIWAEDSNPLCGDTIRMDLIIDEKNEIADVCFSGKGCAISQASASMLTDELVGKTLEDAAKIPNEKIYDMLNVPLSTARVKCALLSLVVLKKAIVLNKLK